MKLLWIITEFIALITGLVALLAGEYVTAAIDLILYANAANHANYYSLLEAIEKREQAR